MEEESRSILRRGSGAVEVLLKGDGGVTESLHDIAVELNTKGSSTTIDTHVGAGIQRRVEVDVDEDLSGLGIEEDDAGIEVDELLLDAIDDLGVDGTVATKEVDGSLLVEPPPGPPGPRPRPPVPPRPRAPLGAPPPWGAPPPPRTRRGWGRRHRGECRTRCPWGCRHQ